MDAPFDAITTFLVFLIGLPAIVFQWLAPEIRPIVVKRSGELLIDAGLPVGLGVALVLAGLFAPWSAEWTWPTILAALFGLAAVTAFRIPRKYVRRSAVVERLRRETSRPVRSRGRLNEDSLADLIELGRQSEPGSAKGMVLEALRDLAAEVTAREDYDGDRLADVAVGVLDVAVSTHHIGSSHNLYTGVDVLKHMLRAFEAKADDSFMQSDLLLAIRSMSRLGRRAVEDRHEAVSMAVVQSLGEVGSRHPTTAVAVSQALFEIGVDAIDHNMMLVAMSCGELLTSFVENAPEPGSDVLADTLGLLAHFHAHGASGRAYARNRLGRIEDSLDTGLAHCLERCALHCQQTTQFRTADKVLSLIRMLYPDSA